jgi:hypothetical protein
MAKGDNKGLPWRKSSLSGNLAASFSLTAPVWPIEFFALSHFGGSRMAGDIFGSSSMVEQPAVNRLVVGSSPTCRVF